MKKLPPAKVLFRPKWTAGFASEIDYAFAHGAGPKLGPRDRTIPEHFAHVQRCRSADISRPGRVCGAATKKVNAEVYAGADRAPDAWVKREVREYRNPGPVLPVKIFKE